ncbi:MAG: mannosyltransferase family protein [Candidatus Aquilonibacter sp.]
MRFVFAAWIASRAVIVAAFFVASAHPLASAGNWDGAWYGSIAQHGYGYAQIGAQHDSAFFPLFPMLTSLLLRAGIGWPLAGVLVNNAAFFGALILLHRIASKRWNTATARWCIAFTCACPLSLFASVAYREGVYLFFSALALWCALRSQRLASGLAGAAASAASAIGITLAGALVIQELVQRRSARDIASAALAFAGIAGFALFCYLRFGDPLAFAHTQQGWRTGGIDATAWLRVTDSLRTWEGLRANLMVMVLVPLAAIAIIMQHKALGLLLTLYGLLAIALILVAGEPISADRLAFAVVPVLLAYGRILQRIPVAGAVWLVFSLSLLAYDAGSFARFHWVA